MLQLYILLIFDNTNIYSIYYKTPLVSNLPISCTELALQFSQCNKLQRGTIMPF